MCGFYNIKLISQKSNKVMLLARFFLQRIMFIKFISTLPERLKKLLILNLTAYIPLFVVKFATIILCKKNLARSITWLDFWLISLML